jgi:hypothetical protein
MFVMRYLSLDGNARCRGSRPTRRARPAMIDTKGMPDRAASRAMRTFMAMPPWIEPSFDARLDEPLPFRSLTGLAIEDSRRPRRRGRPACRLRWRRAIHCAASSALTLTGVRIRRSARHRRDHGEELRRSTGPRGSRGPPPRAFPRGRGLRNEGRADQVRRRGRRFPPRGTPACVRPEARALFVEPLRTISTTSMAAGEV